MALFKNKKEIGLETVKWIKNNRELYEYVTHFEQEIISKNKLGI